ncbi:MAG TPA: NUDIX domain-containing protein [Patescibacteria group bacterium]
MTDSPENSDLRPKIVPVLTPKEKTLQKRLERPIIGSLMELLKRFREKLPVVADSERLVSKDFRYGQDEIKKEVLDSLNPSKTFKEYLGHDRLMLSPQGFDERVSNGTLFETLTGKVGEKRPSWFVEMPHRYVGGHLGGEPKADTTDIRNFGPDNFAKYPLHPFAKEMLEKGAFTGPGFYYRLGPNYTADSVILREEQGKLQALLIVRTDGQGVAVPGGMIEGKDLKDMSTAALKVALRVAKRETGEEAGIDLEHIKSLPIPGLQKVVVGGDTRGTVEAWPETTVFVFMPNKETAAKLEKPVGKDDAESADWKWIDVGVDMLSSHKSYLWLGIREWEKANKKVVRKDGTIGRAPLLSRLRR